MILALWGAFPNIQAQAPAFAAAKSHSEARKTFANSHNRNPLAKANTVFINNVNYNYQGGYTTHTSTPFKLDIVNNYAG